jgi:hypothetical protein
MSSKNVYKATLGSEKQKYQRSPLSEVMATYNIFRKVGACSTLKSAQRPPCFMSSNTESLVCFIVTTGAASVHCRAPIRWPTVVSFYAQRTVIYITVMQYCLRTPLTFLGGLSSSGIVHPVCDHAGFHCCSPPRIMHLSACRALYGHAKPRTRL